MLNVLIVDSHPLFRSGLAAVLQQIDGKVEVSESGDLGAAIERLGKASFDLVIANTGKPFENQSASLEDLFRSAGESIVVVVSDTESPQHAQRAMDAGARGFLPKSTSADVVLHAFHLILAGETYIPPILIRQPSGMFDVQSEKWDGPKAGAMQARLNLLTPRQLGVLGLIGQGLSNRDIADRLDISEGTVKVHVGAILKVLGVANRTQAALLARVSGIDADIPPPATAKSNVVSL